MIHEVRHYICVPGRLPALLKRFETKTLALWKKHAINPVGFWTVLIGDGNNELYYLLAWDSLADREKKWNGVHVRSGMDRGARRQREGRTDPRQDQQQDTGADRVLADEIAGPPMSRGLDHIVHAVRDLDAAAALYRGLGFTVGARTSSAHPWGTQNRHHPVSRHLHRIAGAGRARTSSAPHAPHQFSFGAFNRDFLTRGEGLSMLVLEGQGRAPTRTRFPRRAASAASNCMISSARASGRTARR